VSCSKVSEPIKKASIGSRVINYEPSENVDSLIIPPDLTEPSSKGVFSQVIESDDDLNISSRVQNVEVMRDQYRRWLLVDLSPGELWSLSKEFFRSYGFKIEKENQEIGLFETDYLEIETKVPDKSLGAIRAALSKALKTQYGLPIADKYRVRIEPTDTPNKSELYLTLSSIGEVASGAMRVWQPREKDVELETEMLLKLMVFLGSDSQEAIQKIQSNTNEDKGSAILTKSELGYPELSLPLDKKESWRFLGWALDELSVDISDRDQLSGSFYIKVTPDRGFFSKLINTVSSIKTYQLALREDSSSMTKVIFVDLKEENDSEAIQYSTELFEQISLKF
jgi:outer membrane protein assembly factor BamC